MTIQAPAKVNLVLRILGKRADGYHEIETLMAPVSLADELEIEVTSGSGIEFNCDAPELPTGPENLVWKAAELFAKQTGLEFHAKISLRKRIPSGAGLGGGSSDAAAVLKALDQLLSTNLSLSELENLAATLGSDVPFFIRCRPAWCRGRGEQIDGPVGIPAAPLLLIKPPFPVPTGWAYNAWSQGRPSRSAPQNHSGVDLLNDFEGPVFKKYLLLPAIKNWLLEQEEVSAAMLSGSGSTLFAILHEGGPALAARARVHFGKDLWICETSLALHPARL